MSFGKIANSIRNSNAFQKLTEKTDDVCNAIGRKISPAIDKHPKLDNFIKAVEPTGANNAFIPMTTLMLGTVIVPRVLTAAKRNPDNKEATQDEIKEILFRDVQTVAIVLFFLKMLNSVIAGKASKISGLPMTNKPYVKVFDTDKKGISGLAQKAREFMDKPGEKLKAIGRNILDTIHPTDGVRALTNDEYVSRYSNVTDMSDIRKIFKEIEGKNGNPEKIFNNVMKSLIDKQSALVSQLNGSGLNESYDKANKVLDKLKETQKMGYSAISKRNTANLDENVKIQLVEFFKNPNNKLVKDAKKLNAALRTGALAIESLYLGFGLPALNQKRLERKYLSDDGKTKNTPKNPMIKEGSFNPLITKNLQASEVKVFKDFVKQ